MGLEELSSFMECVRVLLVSRLLLLDDLVEILPTALFLNALSPLLFDLGKLLFLVLEVGLCLITLLVLLAHLLIVGLKGTRVLLVSIFVTSAKVPLSKDVLILDSNVILVEIFLMPLQLSHGL